MSSGSGFRLSLSRGSRTGRGAVDDATLRIEKLTEASPAGSTRNTKCPCASRRESSAPRSMCPHGVDAFRSTATAF